MKNMGLIDKIKENGRKLALAGIIGLSIGCANTEHGPLHPSKLLWQGTTLDSEYQSRRDAERMRNQNRGITDEEFTNARYGEFVNGIQVIKPGNSFTARNNEFYTCNYGDSDNDGLIDAHEIMVGDKKTEFRFGEKVSFGSFIYGRKGSYVDFKLISDEKGIVNETGFFIYSNDCGKFITYHMASPGEDSNLNNWKISEGNYSAVWKIGDEVIGTVSKVRVRN